MIIPLHFYFPNMEQWKFEPASSQSYFDTVILLGTLENSVLLYFVRPVFGLLQCVLGLFSLLSCSCFSCFHSAVNFASLGCVGGWVKHWGGIVDTRLKCNT